MLRLAGRALPTPAMVAGPLPDRASLLLVRPDHLGDLLLTLPAITGLRAALPQARLTVLAGPWSAEILAQHPAIDQVLVCAFPGFDRRPRSQRPHPYALLLSEAARLRSRRFDAALIFRPDAWWAAMLCALSGVPRRYGFDVPEVQPFLTTAIPTVAAEHVTAECLRLATAAAGRPVSPGSHRVYPAPADQAQAAAVFAEARRPRAIVVHAGSGAPVKRWDDRATVATADQIASRIGAEILYTAGPSEVTLAQRLAEASREPARVVAGLPPLAMAAVLQRCALALGPDSGVLHLAAAVGTPTVRLYGPADARRFGPAIQDAAQVVVASAFACAPCGRLDHRAEELPYHRCVYDLSTERVLAAAWSVLGVA